MRDKMMFHKVGALFHDSVLYIETELCYNCI